VKKEETLRALIKKAEKSLLVAKLLHEKGYYNFSVSRAYYTMFYCAEVLLYSVGLSFSKHSGVISGFGKEFIKTGKMPERLHQYLREAFDARNLGDYEVMEIEGEESEEMVKRAEEFLKETKKFLEGGQNAEL